MAGGNQAVLAEIDSVLDRRNDLYKKAKDKGSDTLGQEGFIQLSTTYAATIERLAPPESQYIVQMKKVMSETYGDIRHEEKAQLADLQGILKALRDDYEVGRLRTYRELVNSDFFSDFLSMAEYLLTDEKLKDPAAVLAGGVLEEHLRKLCDKNGVATTTTDAGGKQHPKKLDTMNADLAKQNVYGKNDQKQITAWAGIRNDAAHAQFGNYRHEQVVLMIAGIRDFIGRYPA